MQTDILLYPALLSQIIILSFYFPRRALDRIRRVFETYPPAEFPRLYPGPVENYERARLTYKRINTVILLAGLALFAVLLITPRSGAWDLAIVNWFYMLQISPVVLAEIWAIRYYRRMREADTRTTRSADLQPRRLFDFVSPVLVGLAGFVYVAFCVLIVYIEQFDFPWFGGYLNIVVISATNLLIAGTIIWKLRGKKSDPYQTRGDRRSEIGLLINQMVLASIAVSTYAAISVILSSLDLRHYKAAAGCLYLIVLSANCFRKLRIDNLNFDVYRGDAGDPPGVSESEGRLSRPLIA